MKKLLLLALLSLPLWGQNAIIQPDVSMDFTFAATGTVQLPFSTEGLGIKYWTYEYKSTGFSVVSIQLEGADDSSGAPGSFTAYNGTLVIGNNPSTSITGALTNMVVNPTATKVWVQMHASTLTGSGSLHGRLYGYRNFPACGPPCIIAGSGGGGTPVVPVFGTNSTALSLSSSGLTQIIALSGTTQIRLTHISLSFASAVDFQLEYGTGVACAAGTTALTGVYKGILTIVLSFTLDPLLVPAGNALCVNLGSGVVGGGLAKYAQF